MRHEVGVGRLVENKVIQINDLTPETDYIIRIRAANGAGSSVAEYEISTSVLGGNQPQINWLKFNNYKPASNTSIK